MKYNQLINNDFASQLIAWYQSNKRDLPWRKTVNPYRIWVSEIILQQTRVNQGLPYFERFLEQFPSIESLAKSSEQKILKVWEGLGYYSRARNMHKCAKEILQKYDGNFPKEYDILLSLPGIGRYTAAAIASFAFSIDVPTVDGNVIRVITRLFRISDEISKNSTFNLIFSKALALLPSGKSALFNQALMDLGSTICLPKNPKCQECPIQVHCQGFLIGNPTLFPVKKQKNKIRKRFFNYVILKSGNKILMQKREGNDIWKGLYEFFLIESEQAFDPSGVLNKVPHDLLNDPEIVYESKVYRHLLSHQVIIARFIEIDQAKRTKPIQKTMKFYGKSEIERLPKSVLISKYLEERSI